MKKILTTVVLALTFVVYSHAQQDVQYSNYMFNKLMHNAGYAGSKDAACLSISHRSQWLGLEGAPTTTGIQFHTPAFNDKVGFGLYIQNDRLGITDDWELGLSYAYHLLLGKRNGKLSIGLLGMIRQYSVNFSEGIVIDQSDESLPKTDGTKYVPNFNDYEMFLFYLVANCLNAKRGAYVQICFFLFYSTNAEYTGLMLQGTITLSF